MWRLHAWVERRLPAWLAGGLTKLERAAVGRHLARCPRCRAASEQVAELGRLLRAHDPATPVEPRATEALLPRLRAELASQPVWAPVAPRRPALAALAAILLFGGGLALGSRAFPRVATREVVREVRVPTRVEVPVVQRVEVPVTKVVTVTRTRTVVRTVYRDRVAPAAPTTKVVREPSAPPTPARVVALPTPALVSTALRPATVRF